MEAASKIELTIEKVTYDKYKQYSTNTLFWYVFCCCINMNINKKVIQQYKDVKFYFIYRKYFSSFCFLVYWIFI